jgi:hypothetical protein
MSHATPAHSDHGHGGGAHGAAVAEPGSTTEHGHAELPPEPRERHITPAPEDFVNLPGPSAMFWPFLWAGLAVLLIAALLKAGWPAYVEHASDAHAAPAQGGK